MLRGLSPGLLRLSLYLKGVNMKAWTIKQLHDQLAVDLTCCHTTHERIMVKAIGGKEIREKAIQWAKERKLTPGEVAIASLYGYHA
jgi:hypothetical protein